MFTHRKNNRLKFTLQPKKEKVHSNITKNIKIKRRIQMKINCKAEIVKIDKLKEDIYKFSVQADEIVKQAKPRAFY